MIENFFYGDKLLRIRATISPFLNSGVQSMYEIPNGFPVSPTMLCPITSSWIRFTMDTLLERATL